MPVTMPGRAMGSKTMNEIASRPKNLLREMATAISVPSTMAMSEAISATPTDNHSAFHRSARSARATRNHSVVKPGGGKVNADSCVLNAYRMMRSNGK